MSRGKPHKGQPVGSRSASGRKRDRSPVRVEPCEGVQRRRALYGQPANDMGDAVDRHARRGRMETSTCDALGRAFCAGLLGTGEHAERLLNAGRKIAWQWNRVHGFSTPDSLARFQPSTGGVPMDVERERIMEDALNDTRDTIRGKGRQVQFAFDQLVIDLNPDCGPPWLDRIVWAHKQGRGASEADGNMLRLALMGMEAVA